MLIDLCDNVVCSLPLQLQHLLQSICERNQLSLGLGSLVVSVSDVYRSGLLLGSSNDENVVVLLELSLTNLLGHGVGSNINVAVKAVLAELGLDLLDVVVGADHDWDDHDLTGREPERPLSGVMLSQDGNETLERTVDGTMDHDWSGVVVDGILSILLLDGGLTGVVLELELLWKLEVELDGGALMLLSHGVGDGDINLWSVESTILWVESPLAVSLSSKPVKSLSQLSLSLVPGLNLSEVLFWAGRQLELEGEAKSAVNLLQKVKETLDLILNL